MYTNTNIPHRFQEQNAIWANATFRNIVPCSGLSENFLRGRSTRKNAEKFKEACHVRAHKGAAPEEALPILSTGAQTVVPFSWSSRLCCFEFGKGEGNSDLTEMSLSRIRFRYNSSSAGSSRDFAGVRKISRGNLASLESSLIKRKTREESRNAFAFYNWLIHS